MEYCIRITNRSNIYDHLTQLSIAVLNNFIGELNGRRRVGEAWVGLVKREHPESDVERILELNLLRLYRDTLGSSVTSCTHTATEDSC